MMLRNPFYPPNKPVGQGLTPRREVIRASTQATDFDLERGKDNNVNRQKKKTSKYLQEIIICMVLVCYVC